MIHSIITLFIYITVFATGASGLIYQVVWQRYLSRILGCDSAATAIILGTFLGGLSFGYYLCGKLTTKTKAHFKVYAFLELIIGTWCLCFPTLFKSVESLAGSWSFNPPVVIIIQGLVCAVLLIGIPTICMGGTIPFLTRGLSGSIESATNVHANVYAINTFGAFAGTLIAGFYMIPVFGLPLTVTLASVLNIAAFVFFYIISGYPDYQVEKDSGVSKMKDCRERNVLSSPFLYIIAFLSGFYVMALENVLIRITKLSIGSSSYSFTMIVAVFILSIAAGSYVIGKMRKIHNRLLFYNQFFIMFFLILIYLFLDTLPYYAHLIRAMFQANILGFKGYYLFVFISMIAIFILPVGLMGATAPIIFHELKRKLSEVGKHSGILFSVNTIGSLIGSLAGGIVFFYFLNIDGVFLMAVLFVAISACFASINLPKQYFISAASFIALILIFAMYSPFYDIKNFNLGTFPLRRLLPYSLSGPDIFFKKYLSKSKELFYKDGPASTVAVLEYPYFPGKPLAIISNGKNDSSTISDIYTLKLLAHLPGLIAESRKNVIVIGLGTGVTAGEFSLYNDNEQIDIAEISPMVVKALPLFGRFTYNVHKNPRVKIHIGDAFRILGRSDKKWDIICSEPSNPRVTGVDMLFSREFYMLAKKHLTKNGMLVQWIHTYAANPEMIGLIMNTIRKVFSQTHVFMVNERDLLILATNKKITASDLIDAEKTLLDNGRVLNSLKQISIESIDSLLLRQIWSSSYIKDNFSSAGIQTLDNPVLHYIAGKCFFTGERIDNNFLLNFLSADYSEEYLLSVKYDSWSNYRESEQHLNDLVHSLYDKIYQKSMPMHRSIKMRAFQTNPDTFPLSENEKNRFRPEIINYIMHFPEDEAEWKKIGLYGASIRSKAEFLISYNRNNRDWILNYPVDGLKDLLKHGIAHGADLLEKNWCILQLILILEQEKAHPALIKSIYQKLARNKAGNILIRSKDIKLFHKIQGIIINRKL